MATVYNYSELTTGTNIVEWALIINNWTGGYLMGGLVIMGFLISFGISRAAKVPFDQGFTATSFVWLLISIFLWAIQFGNYTFLPTFIPFFFAIMVGFGVMALIIGKVWSNG